MNSENRTYWTAWSLEKAQVRVRLSAGERAWLFSPSELRAQWVVDDEVWSALEAAVTSNVRDVTIDVALDPEPDPRRDEELDISVERRRTLVALRADLDQRRSRFLADRDAPSGRPDARAWGRELAARFTASLRALMSDPRGPALLRTRVLYVTRTDDVGTPMPDLLDDAGKEALVESIEAALGSATLEVSECEAFLAQLAGHPLPLSDWAIDRWRNEAERDGVRAWLSFLGGLSLTPTVWTSLGCDGECLTLYASSTAQRIALATRYRSALAGALDDTEFRDGLEGWVVHESDGDDDERSRWVNARRESLVSIAFRKLLDVLERPELETPGLRDVDRRVLLQALPSAATEEVGALLTLLRSAFWQGLAVDDIERWLKLAGFAILFYRPTEAAWEYLAGGAVIQFWVRVAESDRTPASKSQLFATALEIARTHDCVQFDEMNDLMVRFEGGARPELVASGATER